VEVVREELLKALSDQYQAPEPTQRPATGANGASSAGHDGNFTSRLDVERWLADRGISFKRKPRDSQGRAVLILEKCPFTDGHEGDSCITQDQSGKVGAQCFHNGCSGKGWQQFKEKIGKPEGHHYDPPLTGGNRIKREESSAAGVVAKPAFELPKPFSALRRTADADRWLAYGLIAMSGITLLTAFWKSGKTTSLAHLFKAMETGGTWFGKDVIQCGGLIVSEEAEDLWAERRDQLAIGDHMQHLGRPSNGRPTLTVWIEFLKFLASEVGKHGHKLVVFDSIPNFWAVENENDAADMTASVAPLRLINDAGAAVLLAHHPRKQEGNQGTAARGSGALSGFVDVLLELRRMNPDDQKDRQRVLSGVSRYVETPAEVVAELSPDGMSYTVLGSKFEARKSAMPAIIMAILPPDEAMAKTVKQVREEWPEGKDRPCERTIRNALEAGLKDKWKRKGDGVKNDSYSYWLG